MYETLGFTGEYQGLYQTVRPTEEKVISEKIYDVKMKNNALSIVVNCFDSLVTISCVLASSFQRYVKAVSVFRQKLSHFDGRQHVEFEVAEAGG